MLWFVTDEADKALKRRAIMEMLDAGADPNEVIVYVDSQPGAGPRQTVLSYAISQGEEDIAKLLIERGANPNAENTVALFSAIEGQKKELALLLIAKGANANAHSPTLRRFALAAAVWYQQTEVAKALLQAGANPNVCTAEDEGGGCTPDYFYRPPNEPTPMLLMTAQKIGDPELVRALLAHGADRKPARPGEPSLLWQALLRQKISGTMICVAGTSNCSRSPEDGYDRLAMVRVALEAGDDPNERLSAGMDPAEKSGLKSPLEFVPDSDTQLITLLLDHGARAEGANLPDGAHAGPITRALLEARYFLAGELLRRSTTEVVHDEPDALRLAVFRRHADLVKGLLLHRASVNGRGRHGETALHIAADMGDLNMTRLLLAAGADPNARMKSTAEHRVNWLLAGGNETSSIPTLDPPDWEMTPLMLAAYRGHLDVVRALLQWHADKDLKSAKGESALTFAQSMLQQPVVDLLGEGRATAKPTGSAFRLADRTTGQPIGDAWIISTKVRSGFEHTWCVAVHVAKTDPAGGIPREWWQEYGNNADYLYKPGMPLMGGFMQKPEGISYDAHTVQALGYDAGLDAASARIAELSRRAGNIGCSSASRSERRELYPIYKAMIAEAYSLATQPEQFRDANQICEDLYYASLENPSSTPSSPDNDLQKAEFLRVEAPVCLERHEATPERNLLDAALADHDAKTVARLLPNKPDEVTRARLLNPALSKAAFAGDKAMMKTLLEHGANPDAVDSSGLVGTDNPRIGKEERLAMVKLLLDFGAPANNYLAYAEFSDDPDSVAFLLKHGAKANMPIPCAGFQSHCDPRPKPIHSAGSVKVAELLVKAGADVTARHGEDTVLTEGAATINAELASFMIRHGADINAAGKFNEPPLMSALRNYEYARTTRSDARPYRALAVLLVQSGARLDFLGDDILQRTTDEGLRAELRKIALERKKTSEGAGP